MSYDDWKTDPDYEDRLIERMNLRNEEEAIRKGYGEYDRPYEAYMCACANTVYRGLHYGEPCKEVPRRDY